MDDRGYVTVFLTLILSVLLMLVAAVYQLVDLSCARGRSAAALRSAMSGVRADYDRYLFEQYHVLFLNQDQNGEGQGGLEERVQCRLEDNLGEEYVVRDVILNGVVGVTDDNCAEFRRQVKDASLYLAADKGVDVLKEKVNGKDEVLSKEDMDQLNMEKDKKTKKQKGDEDPRKYTKAVDLVGVAYWILPENVSFSDYTIDASTLPSEGKSGKKALSVNAKFNSMTRLKTEAAQSGGWLESAEEETAGLGYAASCFNCLTDKVQEDTEMNMELEYLIAGKSTDAENYKSVIDQITAIRTVCNFAYIIRDASKMARLSALAWSVTWYFPPAQPAVKYLLAAAWSYTEAVADAYRLVRGKKVPYMKTADTWLTDLDGLTHLEDVMGDEEEEDKKGASGLDYEDYLLILLAPRMSTGYYRMLDIMQLNANKKAGGEKEYFNLKNAITAFGITTEVEYEGQVIRVREELGY